MGIHAMYDRNPPPARVVTHKVCCNEEPGVDDPRTECRYDAYSVSEANAIAAGLVGRGEDGVRIYATNGAQRFADYTLLEQLN